MSLPGNDTNWLAGQPLKVVVTGAESTGKSTLATQLHAQLGWPLVPEAARWWVDSRRRPVSRFDLPGIAQRVFTSTQEAIEVAGREGQPGVLLDTDILLTSLYARHYLGLAPHWLSRLVSTHRADLYLFCQPDFPFSSEADQRGSERDQARIHAMLCEALSGTRVVEVAGSPLDRLATALEAVENLLNAARPGARLRTRP